MNFSKDFFRKRMLKIPSLRNLENLAKMKKIKARNQWIRGSHRNALLSTQEGVQMINLIPWRQKGQLGGDQSILPISRAMRSQESSMKRGTKDLQIITMKMKTLAWEMMTHVEEFMNMKE
jgi:adenine C2-methylase RlmN of 23S rRNA A2503 and tRNA A37